MKNSILLLSLGVVAFASAQIIPVPEVPPKETAELIADDLADGLNPELARRIKFFTTQWETTWENDRPGGTPDLIFQKLGTRGGRLLLAGGLERNFYQATAQALGMTFEELVGDNKYQTTKYPVEIAPDGKVTVDMPD